MIFTQIVTFNIFIRVVFSLSCKVPIVNYTRMKIKHVTPGLLRSSSQKGMRIYIAYSDHFDDPDLEPLKKIMIEPAIQYWQNTLTPKKPIVEKMLIKRVCPRGSFKREYKGKIRDFCLEYCEYPKCYTYTIPEKYLDRCYFRTLNGDFDVSGPNNSGVEADLLLFVTYEDSGCGMDTAAFATACMQSEESDMPIVGMANICPGQAGLDKLNLTLINIMKHEVAHVLGFSVNLYAFFLSENGTPLTPRRSFNHKPVATMDIDGATIYKPSDETWLKVTYNHVFPESKEKSEHYVLVTQGLKKLAKEFYSCPSADGVILENDGALSNAVSHLESRIYHNEVMTPFLSVWGPISLFTLTLMQDTGWYKVDFTMAEPFLRGKDSGCTFIRNSCFEYVNKRKTKSLSIFPFCDYFNEQTKCNPDHSLRLTCHLSINKIYQSRRCFKNQSLFFDYPFAENSPIPEVNIDYYGNLTFNGVCKDTDNNKITAKNNFWLQKFGPSSKCINHPPRRWIRMKGSFLEYAPKYGSSCHEVRCIKPDTVIIYIADLNITCKESGTKYWINSTVDGYSIYGQIICSSYDEICERIIVKGSMIQLNDLMIHSFILMHIVFLHVIDKDYSDIFSFI